VPFPLVLYDESCRFCTALAVRLSRRGLGIATIGSPTGDLELRDLSTFRRYDSVHVIDAAGRRYSAGAAIPVVLRPLPGGWALAGLAGISPRFTEAAYRLLARYRSAVGRVLRIH